MKMFLLKFLTIVVVATGLVLVASPLFAQAPPLPPPPGGSAAAPLDGFTWMLLLGGIGAGYKAISKDSSDDR